MSLWDNKFEKLKDMSLRDSWIILFLIIFLLTSFTALFSFLMGLRYMENICLDNAVEIFKALDFEFDREKLQHIADRYGIDIASEKFAEKLNIEGYAFS